MARALTLAFLLVFIASAFGAAPALAVCDGEVLVGYGADCPTGTHRGADVALAAGSDVPAVRSGTVSFAGQVPSDGGGTCGAVTIALQDGRLISTLPLAEVFVSEGDAVAEGEILGTLAQHGDGSCSQSHVHIGLRRNGAYLDPAGLLEPRAEGVAASEPPPVSVPAESVTRAAPPTTARPGGVSVAVAPGARDCQPVGVVRVAPGPVTTTAACVRDLRLAREAEVRLVGAGVAGRPEDLLAGWESPTVTRAPSLTTAAGVAVVAAGMLGLAGSVRGLARARA